MNKTYKKTIVLFSLLVLFTAVTIAQQQHFIYLQTENKNPFYIKMDKKVLSSAASGYLIIPKLQDGSYMLTIGFPKNEWPEQHVTCIINKKDAGYLVKNFGTKGWGLFNLQTMEVLMFTANPVEAALNPEDIKQDIFSNTLSGVVNDPSIIIKSAEEKAIAKQDSAAKEEKLLAKQEDKPALPEKKPVNTEVKQEATLVKEDINPLVKEEIKPVEKEKETVGVTDTKPAKIEVKQESRPSIQLIKKEESLVTSQKIDKLFSFASSEGTDMVYVDIVNGVPDTIRLFIPAEKNTNVAKRDKKTIPPVIEPVAKTDIKKDSIKPEIGNTTVIKPGEEKETVTQEPLKEILKVEEVEPLVPKSGKAKQAATKKETVKSSTKASNTKFIDIELPNPNAVKKDTATTNTIVKAEEKNTEPAKEIVKTAAPAAKPLIFNSDCKSLAADDDYLKLRKKMNAADNPDDMVTVAKKAFKTKCFTTEQVKNLSALFLKDEGRYKFFDTAYPFVSDSYNFGSLESQLTDNYFITRFKAMIHH